MINYIIPKRPGEERRKAEKAYQQQLVRDYFQGLHIQDVKSEVVGTRILDKEENCFKSIKITPTKTIIEL
ncbi:hypothetical protein [Arcicella lustrica]|uniref:Uncharacterized protein n=1 Tax=Arcicella lustrica TaxID=2984196 RepID=A0ABU5SDM6_9BACT|nr:hypothetical protein [Arcicella sp. DC25W]MEA5425346.1 hypothetical protein [Arcicella sp. DC25W]